MASISGQNAEQSFPTPWTADAEQLYVKRPNGYVLSHLVTKRAATVVPFSLAKTPSIGPVFYDHTQIGGYALTLSSWPARLKTSLGRYSSSSFPILFLSFPHEQRHGKTE